MIFSRKQAKKKSLLEDIFLDCRAKFKDDQRVQLRVVEDLEKSSYAREREG